MELISLLLANIFWPLIRQKPPGSHHKAKTLKDLTMERLKKWEEGKIEELLEEGEFIQKRLPNSLPSKDPEHRSKVFSRLVLQGKIGPALRAISNSGGGVAAQSPNVLRSLQEKHPEPAPIHPPSLLPGSFIPPPPCIYEQIDADLIRSISLKSHGAAGPSGLDADDWRRLTCSNRARQTSQELCETVADLAKRLCTEFVDPDALTTFVAGRLVPLEKGANDVRPIGIGETIRRVCAKAVGNVLRKDIQKAAGTLQVCCGMKGGCEAAIHAMRETFEKEETEAALLIDASNAFNSIHRETCLHNISILCPVLYTFLINTYRVPINLYVPSWACTIMSVEGTTQGDPCAMQMYALGVVPLIQAGQKETDNKYFLQVWYADDATGAGKLTELRKWWDVISKDGPNIGYYPKASKTILVVKPEKAKEAQRIFRGTNIDIEAAEERIHSDTGITIEDNGTRHLGATLGTQEFKEKFLQKKIEKLAQELQSLADISITQPQAAYTAYMWGFKSKWQFLQRVSKDSSHLFAPLENIINNSFIPKCIGHLPNPTLREVFALPTRAGGLGLENPTKTATAAFEASNSITQELKRAILTQNIDFNEFDEEKEKEAKKNYQKEKTEREKDNVERVKALIRGAPAEDNITNINEPKQKKEKEHDPPLLRALEIAADKGASNWLTSLPLERYNFALSKTEWRDAVGPLRYLLPPKNFPSTCACGAPNSVIHAQNCHLGGFLGLRHDSVRNTIANLLEKAKDCNDIEIEKHLTPLDIDEKRRAPRTSNTTEGARMDVTALGFWGPLQRVFCDIRVFNPLAPSKGFKSAEAQKKDNEKEKKDAYQWRVKEIEKGTFTPLVFTVQGGCGRECDAFLKQLSEKIAKKSGEDQSSIMAWIRTKLSFALVRTSVVCLRGWRKKDKRKHTADNKETEFAISTTETKALP